MFRLYAVALRLWEVQNLTPLFKSKLESGHTVEAHG